jgi:bacteriorhodopsin
MNSSNYLPEKQEKAGSENKKTKNPYVKFSFMITYILLLTTATITFIEALRTNNPTIRHIFNLETCISLIASYFYLLFLDRIDKSNTSGNQINWTEITELRYIDWSITTPFMLLSLLVVLAFNSKKIVHITLLLPVILLNYIMLFAGYLGEINYISRLTGMIIGFIAFFIMFFIIYLNYMNSTFIFSNALIYWLYFIVWSIYGIVYMFNEEAKNIITNLLDCIAKCLIGIFLWVYYTGIVKS